MFHCLLFQSLYMRELLLELRPQLVSLNGQPLDVYGRVARQLPGAVRLPGPTHPRSRRSLILAPVPDMTPEAPSVRRKVMRGVLRVVLAVVVGVTVGPSITRGTLLREAVRRGASPPRHSPEWRSGPSDPLTSTPQGACLVSPTCQACLTTILLRLPRSRNRKLSKMCFATMSPIVRVC